MMLLRQFGGIVQRQGLKEALHSKYMMVFANYGHELDVLREHYEAQKDNPPIARNAPPVSGNIGTVLGGGRRRVLRM
jgi:dynein heavy chain